MTPDSRLRRFWRAFWRPLAPLRSPSRPVEALAKGHRLQRTVRDHLPIWERSPQAYRMHVSDKLGINDEKAS